MERDLYRLDVWIGLTDPGLIMGSILTSNKTYNHYTTRASYLWPRKPMTVIILHLQALTNTAYE